MMKTITRSGVVKKLEKLAFGSANDVVRLALADPEGQTADISQLELTQLSELRRKADGSIEVKLVDRLAAIGLLLEVLGGAQKAEDMDRFLSALQGSADAGGDVQ